MNKNFAIVIDYPVVSYESLQEKYPGFKSAPSRPVSIFVTARRYRPEMPAIARISGEKPAEISERIKGRKFSGLFLVQHEAVAIEHIEKAEVEVSGGGKRAFFLVPGLNETFTLGRPILSAFHFGAPDRGAGAAIGVAAPFITPQRRATPRTMDFILKKFTPEGMAASYDLGDEAVKRLFFDEFSSITFPAPQMVMIALSNTCNMRCKMCFYHSPLYSKKAKSDYFRTPVFMSTETVEKLVEGIKPHRVFFHVGDLDEPLLHPDIVNIVEMLSKTGFVHITSNGTLWTPRLAEGLIRNGLGSVTFSLDAANADTYREIRGQDLEKTMGKILSFLDMRAKTNPRIMVNMCIIDQPGASEEIESFKEYWQNIGVSSVSVFKRLELTDQGKYIFSTPAPFFREPERLHCQAPWDSCAILPEGVVTPCCNTMARIPRFGPLVMGDVRREKLTDIWKNDVFRDLRRHMLNRRYDAIPFCRDCSYWSQGYMFEEQLPDDTIRNYSESAEYFFFPPPDKNSRS